MFEFNQLSLHIAGNQILNEVSGSITRGAITALIGPNGSGKSSLLSLLSGINEPSSGQIFINEQPLNTIKRTQLAKILALLPQHNPVPATLTVADLIAFGRHPHRPWYKQLSKQDKELIEWAMQETGINHYAQRLLTDLSGGELQRTWLAMVLAQDTQIVMLDEPTSWLDISHQLSLLNIVKRLNEKYHKTIVWVLHDLNQARQFSHQAMLINQGQVVNQGAVDNVINAQDISDIYHTKVTMQQVGKQQILWPEEQS